MKRLAHAIEKLRTLTRVKREVASGGVKRYAYKGFWPLCESVNCPYWKEGKCLLLFSKEVVKGSFGEKVSEEEKTLARKFLEAIDGCLLDQL
ncbi:MAG: hypothetical protein DRN81_05715 [Thermoproteota archaeon]|nr:MAG: hypothetical protein DRN81_05715 [Candidatus Korarchaeota archaeon]RLI82209.1 MAG: hypothetical protein DRP01_10140 [Archaeoglobales archaeon]